jgi:hypothetical protein
VALACTRERFTGSIAQASSPSQLHPSYQPQLHILAQQNRGKQINIMPLNICCWQRTESHRPTTFLSEIPGTWQHSTGSLLPSSSAAVPHFLARLAACCLGLVRPPSPTPPFSSSSTPPPSALPPPCLAASYAAFILAMLALLAAAWSTMGAG